MQCPNCGSLVVYISAYDEETEETGWVCEDCHEGFDSLHGVIVRQDTDKEL